MTNIINHQVRLAGRPEGLPKSSDWEFTETEVPDLQDGQVLVKIHYISVDPAMRGWMNDRDTYVPALKLGDVMRALTVGEVMASENPAFAMGDFVAGFDGVQEYAISDGSALMKADTNLAPLSAYLNSLGIAGLTAYCGLIEVGTPKAGETVVVSGAAGSVGSHVGQIAKIKGCRTVGIAGGARKCAFLIDELGFDAVIDYKNEALDAGLARTCPDGIDCYFDNVGGPISDAAFDNMAMWARVAICGQIAQYNDTEQAMGPRNLRNFLIKRATLYGLLVFDWRDRYHEGRARLTQWVQEGRIKYREDVVEGLENAPSAFAGLMEGKNFGKQLVRIDADTSR